MSKSSISVGEIVRHVLMEDIQVSSRVRKIFPVVVDNATLPYIVYRRSSMTQDPAKQERGADTVMMQIICYTKDYQSGVELAETVRDALDGKWAEHEGLRMRSCTLTDCQESWVDNAYVQNLIFTIKL